MGRTGQEKGRIGPMRGAGFAAAFAAASQTPSRAGQLDMSLFGSTPTQMGMQS